MRIRHLLPHAQEPLLFAHRGLHRAHIENTLDAFLAARDAGVPGIELDVHLTADEKLVVFHDDRTGRIEAQLHEKTDGLAPAVPASLSTNRDPGPRNLVIEEATLAQIRQLAIGPIVPTLDDVFDALGSSVYYDIELKTRTRTSRGLEAQTAETIRRHGLLEYCVVSSFNPFALRHFRKAQPGIPLGIIWTTSHELYWFLRHGEGAVLGGADFLKPEWDIVMKHGWLLRLSGRPFIPWSVNDPQRARLLLEQGAAGIISDAADSIAR